MALRGEMSFHGPSHLGVFRDLAGALFLPLPTAWAPDQHNFVWRDMVHVIAS